MITIIETLPGKADFHLFQDFPKSIYPSDSLWFKIPETLNTGYLTACYMAEREGKILARAALYANPNLVFEDKKAFCLGNYEAVNDPEISFQLFSHIFEATKYAGAEFIIGPMNGSTWDNYRFGLSHDQPPFFSEPYHHLCYNEHFLKAGFSGIATYHSNIDKIKSFDERVVLAKDRELATAGVRIRNIDIARYEDEMSTIHDFNSFAFSRNFLYTPISKSAFIKKYSAARNILNPDYTLLAEDADGNLIGYYFCMDDFLDTKHKTLIFKTLVRHPDPKWQGLGHVIGNRIYQKALSNGYEIFIHPFIFEKGTSVNLSRNFSGTHYKSYILYGKDL